MKKQLIQKIFLILLPILAVGLATTADSVAIYDTQAGTAVYCSYFDALDTEGLQMLTPLAAILSLASGFLGAAYMATKKTWCLKGIVGTAFCAATLAVVPVLFRGDILIVPNVGVPIFMMAHCLLAYYMLKKPQAEEPKKAPRLNKR